MANFLDTFSNTYRHQCFHPYGKISSQPKIWESHRLYIISDLSVLYTTTPRDHFLGTLRSLLSPFIINAVDDIGI